jgi:hypothetical protein
VSLLRSRWAMPAASALHGVDVLADGAVVRRIMKVAAAPLDAPWILDAGNHGYEPTREAGMSPDFAKCPQSGATRKTYARYEFFSVSPRADLNPRSDSAHRQYTFVGPWIAPIRVSYQRVRGLLAE